MPGWLPENAGGRHADALHELGAELKAFEVRGLHALRDDLVRGVVARGRWRGCPLSYRAGRRGSCLADRHGRPRNLFIALWDAGWLADAEVEAAVDRELRVRSRPLTPAIAGH